MPHNLTTLGPMLRIQVNPVKLIPSAFFNLFVKFLTSSTFLVFFQLVFVHISQTSRRLLSVK